MYSKRLSNPPLEVNNKQLGVLAECIKNVYFPKRKKTNQSVDELRQEMFLSLANMFLRLLSSSKKGLYKHVQRECLDSILAQEPK